MAAGTVIDVALIRRLLSRKRPIAEIIARTGATEEQIARVRRNFDIMPVETPAGQMDWEPHKADLRRFHAENKTSTWVAAHYGVTRNAVIGVWDRMDLPPRNRGPYAPRRRSAEEIQKGLETRRQNHTEYQRAKRAEAREQALRQSTPRRTQGSILSTILASGPAEPIMTTETPPSDVVPILVRDANGKLHANEALKNSNCRWWVGDPVDPKAGFCPECAVDGLPYCPQHATRAFQPPAVRKPRSPAAPKKDRIPTFADAESD